MAKNETRILTIKMKTPEGKFFGNLCENEGGGYKWRDTESNLPPPNIDLSVFEREGIFYEQNDNNAYARSGD